VSEKLALFGAQIIIVKFQNVFDWARRGEAPYTTLIRFSFRLRS